MKKVLIDKVADIKIFLNLESERFFASVNGKQLESRSLFEIRRDVVKLSERVFKGEFYINNYDGIREFEAKFKYTDASGQVWVRKVLVLIFNRF